MNTTVLPTGMGYVITLCDDKSDDELVRFEVEDVERVPWGLGATITVRTKIAGARTLRSGFLTTERVNLLGSRSRRDLALRLADLVPAPPAGAAIDWERLVEFIALSIIDGERRPLELLDLSVVEPADDGQRYIVPHLLPALKATILYGQGGTGKSIFAVALACAVQMGTMFLGWPVEQANVLYLDWETDADDMARRVALASAGLGLKSPAPIRYVNLVGPLQQHQAAIAALCAENNMGFVVLDSVGMATAGARDGGDMAEGAIQFFRALRSLKASVLAIDHVSSEDMKRKGGSPKPFGSVFKLNSARNAFELMDASHPGGPHQLLLRHRKTNLERHIEDMAITADWTDKAVRFRLSVTMPTSVPIEDRILDALESGPASARGLTDLLNDEPGSAERVSEWDVRRAVADMRRRGIVNVDLAGSVRRAPDDQPPLPEEPTLGLDEADVATPAPDPSWSPSRQ